MHQDGCLHLEKQVNVSKTLNILLHSYRERYMKKLCILFLSVIIFAGCAKTRPVNEGALIVEAVKRSPESLVQYWEIPSRGVLADAASVAANGGGAAKQLRNVFLSLGRVDDATLIITSRNPALPEAHIRGAFSKLNESMPNLLVIYAGDSEYSKDIEMMVKTKKMKYEFIDTLNH